MTAATLRAQVVAALQALAWDQWSQLGVSAAPPERQEQRAADPEALLLFTLHIGRTDPRLLDEVLDWLALNEPLISVHRLRNICADPADRALVDAALGWAAKVRGRASPAASGSNGFGELEPLFYLLAPPVTDLDPVFAKHGLARARLEPSRKSQPPRLREPISFAFRLRRLLGVGVRAEVMRILLTVRAHRLPGRIIAASAGFAQRNVREGLTQLQVAGVVDVATVSDERFYAIDQEAWSQLLGLTAAPELPLHYDWIAAYRTLSRILRWLQRPGLDDLTPYLLASEARTLVGDIEGDLRLLGIAPEAYTAAGAAFWDHFVEMTRAAVRNARSTSSQTGTGVKAVGRAGHGRGRIR